jgi:hypothetical protein
VSGRRVHTLSVLAGEALRGWTRGGRRAAFVAGAIQQSTAFARVRGQPVSRISSSMAASQEVFGQDDHFQ